MLSVFSRNCVWTNPLFLFGFFAKFAPKIFFAAIASKTFSGVNFGFQSRWRLDRFFREKCCPFSAWCSFSVTSRFFAKFAPKIFFAAIASKTFSGANFGFQARWRLDRFFRGKCCPFLYRFLCLRLPDFLQSSPRRYFLRPLPAENSRVRTLVFRLGGGWIGFLGENGVLFRIVLILAFVADRFLRADSAFFLGGFPVALFAPKCPWFSPPLLFLSSSFSPLGAGPGLLSLFSASARQDLPARGRSCTACCCSFLSLFLSLSLSLCARAGSPLPLPLSPSLFLSFFLSFLHALRHL